MVILTAPFAAPGLVAWLSESGHAVLDNPFARQQSQLQVNAGKAAFNLVSEQEVVSRLNNGERLYTSAENALEWVEEHVDCPVLTNGIRVCKNKGAFREALAQVGDQLFFRTYGLDDLAGVDPSQLPLPVVLKPVVGFCSVGVYVIRCAQDWANAVQQISDATDQWAQLYPQSVVGTGSFIVEEMITGQEFALDMYYDEAGKARVLNILQHDFSSPEDTKDRLYWFNTDLLRAYGNKFAAWLDQANQAMGLRNFCVHVELRVTEDGRVVPIEFNPLRFAGMGGTDVAWYGFGLITAKEYLTGNAGITADSNVDDFLRQVGVDPTDSNTYSMSVLEIPAGCGLDVTFDFDALFQNLTGVMETYRFDPKTQGALGFLFKRSTESTLHELEYLRDLDITPFVHAVE